MFHVIILSVILFGCTNGDERTAYLTPIVKYQWSSLDYAFPNETARQEAINAKLFVPSAAIPIDFHYHYNETVGGRTFITTPRIAPGVPATIGYIPDDNTTQAINPAIIPYPNWEMNKIDGNCDHIISVYRIQIDKCGRLWIIDTGFNEDVSICPPKILIYDLLTNQLIRTHEFDKKKLICGTKLMTTVIDIRENKCDNAFAYIADPERFQLIVYSYKTDSSWTIRNNYFFPDPHHGILRINNTKYHVMSGISGMALGLEEEVGGRNLYFHTFADVEQQYVPTWVLTHADSMSNPDAYTDKYGNFSMETSQSTTMAISKAGITFFMSLANSTLKCWRTRNSTHAVRTDTILPFADIKMEFPTSFQIETDADGIEYLAALFITPQAMFHGTVNPDVSTNFSLKKWRVANLIRYTKCSNRRRLRKRTWIH